MSRRDLRSVRVRTPWHDSWWRIAARAVGSALIVLVIAVIAALVVVPRLLGGTSLTVLTGSMEPTFRPGDVVVVKGIETADVCTDVSVGDIITFFPEPDDPTLITHRVVGMTIGTFDDGTDCRLITQGDANSAADEPVSPEQVRGVFMYGVPKLGWVRQWTGDHTQVLLIAGAVVLIGWGLWSTFRRPRTRVYAMPGTGVEATEGSTPADGGIPGVPDHESSDPGSAARTNAAPIRDHDLRERELALKERELALRERELDFARHQVELNAPTAALMVLDRPADDDGDDAAPTGLSEPGEY